MKRDPVSHMASRAVTDAITTWDTLMYYTRRPRRPEILQHPSQGHIDDWTEEVNKGAEVVSTKTMTKVF